jgi:SP family sugar:H+ symporter-like MFS transporter
LAFLTGLAHVYLQWQQLTGINFIFYYGTTFFSSAGIKNAFIITYAPEFTAFLFHS